MHVKGERERERQSGDDRSTVPRQMCSNHKKETKYANIGSSPKIYHSVQGCGKASIHSHSFPSLAQKNAIWRMTKKKKEKEKKGNEYFP